LVNDVRTLMKPVNDNDLELLKKLVEEDNVDPSLNGNLAIRRAIFNNHEKIYKYLLNNKTVAESINPYALFYSALRSGNTKCMNFIFKKNKIDLTGKEKNLLDIGLISLTSSEMNFLLRKINIQNLEFDANLLRLSIDKNQKDIVKAIMSKNKDTETHLNKEYNSHIDKCVRLNYYEILSILINHNMKLKHYFETEYPEESVMIYKLNMNKIKNF
jgi:hypothetical protein